MYYLSSLVKEGLSEGEPYNHLEKYVAINLLDFNLIDCNNKIHNQYRFSECEDHNELTDMAEIHFLEFPKLRQFIKDHSEDLKEMIDENALLKWLLFIEEPDSEIVKVLASDIPELKEAEDVLRRISYSEEERERYFMRQKSLKDKEAALYHARREEAVTIAKKLYRMGLPLEKIAEGTNLSVDELKKFLDS